MGDASQSSEFWDEGGLESCFVAQYLNSRYSLRVDEDIPNVHSTSSAKHSPSNIKDVYLLPLTRSCAKKLQEQVNSFQTDCAFMTSKNGILPKCSTFVVLRCTYVEKSSITPTDRTTKLNSHNS